MYTLIKAGLATKMELEEYYDLDEALKLYALYSMDKDLEKAVADEYKSNVGR